MFENVFGQDTVVATLISEITSDSLPGSLLFSGPPLSAKLTTALELARIASCKKRGLWACTCEECARSKSLVNPDVIIIGRKQLPEEYISALDLFDREPGLASRYFLCRSIRKILKRFDPELLPHDTGKVNTIQQLSNPLFEFSELILDESVSKAEILKEGKKLVPVFIKLVQAIPKDVPISIIRAVEAIAHQSPWGKHRTIIIEHADHMQEPAMNALLKILEEPPNSVSFIFTTNNIKALLPTVRSRLRTYTFVQRTMPQISVVYDKIFRLDNYTGTMEQFFQKFSPLYDATIEQIAEQFTKSVLIEKNRFDFASLRQHITDQETLKFFFEFILKYAVSFESQHNQISFEILQKLMYLCRENLKRLETFNINYGSILESFFYSLTTH